MLKTYSELCNILSFKGRYQYLQMNGTVGQDTFGFNRYLNQILYNSEEWKSCRREIIIRDDGCDLGCEGFIIHGRTIVHHINPITVDDILNRNPKVFDPENLICASHITHQAIHYGDENLLFKTPIERIKNDTCPWKKN